MDAPVVSFSLRFNARSLSPVQSERLNSTWIVGTNALREENEVRVLQYDADQERLQCTKALSHPPEVWDLATSAAAADLLLTVWSQGGTYGASLWSMKDGDKLEKIADLAGHAGVIRSVLWHPEQHGTALTVEEGLIHKWDISNAGVSHSGQAQAGELLQLWNGALHPRNPALCATTGGNNVQLWDLRSMTCSGEIASAHRMPARDVSFTTANEHRLVTGGDDCKLRVWDLRMLGKSEALLDLGGHSHWVWRAQFSPFHEQLIASSSSDSHVNLYFIPQLAATSSSAIATGGAGADSAAVSDTARAKATTAATGAPPQAARAGDLDGKAHTYDEHEDSVYGLAWSVADPWLCASLSYDGRVVVNRVPKNIKYKILL